MQVIPNFLKLVNFASLFINKLLFVWWVILQQKIIIGLQMNDRKYLKPNFLLFSLLTFVSNGLIYIIQFFINKERVDYFLCTSIKTYSYSFFSNDLELIYPESCDLKPYALGIVNLNSYYGLTEFVYQDRPLFVVYIAIFFNLIKAFSFSSLSTFTILKISFF